jgi:predicted RNA methylase
MENKGQDIPSEIIQEVFESASNASQGGLSQYQTPPEFAKLCCIPLPDYRVNVTDLNAAAGNLLFAASNQYTEHLLAADIDPCRAAKHEGVISLSRITGDLTKLFPLMQEVGFKSDFMVLNPPWTLSWHKERLAALGESELPAVKNAFHHSDPKLGKDLIDSTVATLAIALEHLSYRGEGYLIANDSTLERLIFGLDAPYRSLAMHVWARLRIQGNPMTGTKDCNFDHAGDFVTAVIYFAKSHIDGPQYSSQPAKGLLAFDQEVQMMKGLRLQKRHGVSISSQYQAVTDAALLWEAIKEEWAVRQGKKSAWNVFLAEDGTIRTQLSVFDDSSKKTDKAAAERLFELNGQRPMQLVVQAAQRRLLVETVNGSMWKVEPSLPQVVAEAVRAYHSVRAPLNPLSPVQALGYLDEENSIKCKHTMTVGGQHLFISGKSYPLRTQTVLVERLRTKPSFTFGEEEFLMNGQELATYIKTEQGEEKLFMDARHTEKGVKVALDAWKSTQIDFTLQDVVKHFDIPIVSDIAEIAPEDCQKYVEELAKIQAFINSPECRKTGDDWTIKRFQISDLSRAALTDGLILSWETGLGKALPDTAKVLTPTGFRQMMDLRVGEKVIGSNGKPTSITGVYPQGIRDAYRVTFSDGTTTLCDLDHLWNVRTKVGRWKGTPFYPRTLRDMIKSGFRCQEGCRFFIPVVGPVEFDPQPASLPIDPYLLGAMLGNGGMSTNEALTFSSNDPETVDEVAKLLPQGSEILHAKDYDYRIRGVIRGHNPLIPLLRGLGLMGKKCDNKFIPEIYKTSSVASRLALLQGLLDTDGHVRPKDNNVEYCTVSAQLAKDVQCLIESLGGTARIRTKQPHCQSLNKCALAYLMSVRLPNQFNPFRLSRKANIYKPRLKYPPTRGVVSAERVGEANMICISVDATDKCYVIEHCLVTHNTIGGFLWMLLKTGWHIEDGGLYPNAPVLIIAPKHLHQQHLEEVGQRFGITEITHLDCQETYCKLRPLKPGWYITSFTELSRNKVQRMPDPRDEGLLARPDSTTKLMQFYSVTESEAAEHAKKAILTLGFVSDAAAGLDLCRSKYDEWSSHVGEAKNGIRCVYQPSLAELCSHDFAGVAIDEATRIKAEASLVGIGCRLMSPKYRLILTATPIKNRLPDLFFLIWWVAGGKEEAHARWPYSSEAGEQERFSQEFLVCERNLTKEKAENYGRAKSYRGRGGKMRRGKATAEVCNIHRLWKLIAPLLLRHRKKDIGEDIVKRIKHPIQAPMGLKQAAVYQYHLTAEYVDKKGEDALLSKLTALRSCAAAPQSPNLTQVTNDQYQMYRSDNEYIPKVAACLEIIEQILRRKEQGVIFSALHEPLDALSRRLTQAGVPHDLLDGRNSECERGRVSLDFKKGRPQAKPLLLAGLGAMGEGHSWHLANNVIILAYDWAWNLFEQAINRVYRLNSPKDINLYPIVCSGTIDRKLDALLDEKGDASELVLDGELMTENVTEVNLHDLLKAARAEWNRQEVYEEETLELEWPELKARLGSAYREWATDDGNGALLMPAAPDVRVSKSGKLVLEMVTAPIREALKSEVSFWDNELFG